MLKRKRSASGLGPPPPHAPPDSATAVSARDAPAPHLPSRTRKRLRNGRPADDEVHGECGPRGAPAIAARAQKLTRTSTEHTLGLLYAAQRRPEPQQPEPEPEPEPKPAALPPPLAPGPSPDQQTLHRFWGTGAASASAASSPPSRRPSPAESPPSCWGCGASLAEAAVCGACGERGCRGCSLGDDGRCLRCAGRWVWVGGIGWTSGGVSVC